MLDALFSRIFENQWMVPGLVVDLSRSRAARSAPISNP